MATLTGVVDTDAAPEAAVSADARVRADLARLLQERLVHESRLGVWVHPILIAVIATLAWPDAPHDLLLGWAAQSCSPRCCGALGCSSPHIVGCPSGPSAPA